jgi:heptaprenyl diphosphate synthase
MTTHATPPVLAVPGATPALAARLRDGLARVDTLLHEVVDHDDPFIARASSHLVEAGGKRFRPLLTLLAAELGKGINDDVVRAAAGVELTHLASLYHDDVMDEASVRRGVPSANAAYDNSTAILVGDLLFGKASELVAGLGAEAVLIQAQTFVRLCAGQIRDDRASPEGVDPVDYYLGVLADKTGVLIATAGRYGVMFGGGPPEAVEIMRAYGEKVGIAFQLADDLIDIASDADDTGKTPGTDLREGVATLAVLRVRSMADAARPGDARLLELLDSDLSHDDDGVAEALALLRAHPALDQARAETYAVAREAQALLDPLPDSDAKAALQALALSVVERVG